MIAQPQADGSRRKSDDDAACNTDEPLTSAIRRRQQMADRNRMACIARVQGDVEHQHRHARSVESHVRSRGTLRQTTASSGGREQTGKEVRPDLRRAAAHQLCNAARVVKRFKRGARRRRARWPHRVAPLRYCSWPRRSVLASLRRARRSMKRMRVMLGAVDTLSRRAFPTGGLVPVYVCMLHWSTVMGAMLRIVTRRARKRTTCRTRAGSANVPRAHTARSERDQSLELAATCPARSSHARMHEQYNMRITA